uniref:PNK FHA domain-containing protein n=1 Tax=Glossina brevipalpis TaxID=37001 RepID=A0A1A9WC07_9MUSC
MTHFKAKVLSRVCLLTPLESEHQIIHINSGKNVLGRSKETGVRDAKCSKKQLELDVDMVKAQIKLKVLGINPSGVNGFMVTKNTECALEHGDILEMIYGRHSFKIIFKPPPERKLQATADNSWISIEDDKLLIFTSAGVKASEKIAAYDVDGTIIKTKSGLVFPKSSDDWMLNCENAPKKLKQLFNTGFKICFFTNQGGISKGKVNISEFKAKMQSIVQKLDVPIQVFIATGEGYYRKPLPGMWEYLQKEANENVNIDKDQSFFVGDAAGRPEVGKGIHKRRKDHSLADRLFAKNLNINFYTPEEHFLGNKQEHWLPPEFELAKYDENQSLLNPPNAKLSIGPCEMIIMLGLPGSGKTHFCEKHLSPLGYFIANADSLKSTKACLEACERFLSKGTSCAVDNTNIDIESRKKFIDLAKKYKTPCRCFVMGTSIAHIKHNLAYRHLIDKKHSKINDMIFNTMKKKYTAPNMAEGFAEIVTVNLKFQFDSNYNESLYKLYLLEK